MASLDKLPGLEGERRKMSSEEASAFIRRWKLVNQREREELRSLSMETRFRQLAALMASVDAFGWRESLREGEEEVRERWRRLKEAYGV